MYAVRKIYDFANQTPDERAIVHDLRPVSYRAWHLMVTAMRHRLATEGLRQGGVAVVWIDSILVGWVVDLALRSIGLTTVSIYHVSEFAKLDAFDVVAILTASNEPGHDVPSAAAPTAARIVVDANVDVIDNGGALEPPPEEVAPGGHILLTSGTTGSPKMLLIDAEQQTELNAEALERMHSIDGLLQVEDQRIMLNLLNFGLWSSGGYLGPIMVWSIGAGVIFHQGAGAERSFAVPGITHALVTPAYIHQILAASPQALPRNDDLQLIVGAGAMSIPLADQVKARLTRRVASTLGSTEAGSWALTPIETEDDLRWHKLNLTKTVEVVDEDDQALPAGHLGFVRVLQTPGITEYLNDPEASAASFRLGYFYSGDLGMMDANGRLALAGRVTDVLNINGDKIPSGPVEEAFQNQLKVSGACAFTAQGADMGEHLHIALETPAPIDQAVLKSLLERMRDLPRVQVHFHFLSEFPRNKLGKIERLKLRRRLVERQAAVAAE